MDLFESFSGDPENSSANGGGMSGGISRRSVMKAGAAAAWSVPLVQVVAAAPAVAVSGAPILSFTAQSGSYPNKNSQTLRTSVTLKNTGGVTQNLLVTFSFPAPAKGTTWTPSVDQPAGWTVDTTGQATTHVFTANTQLASGTSVTLSPTFTVLPANKGNAVNITVTATAAGNVSAQTVIQVPNGV